MKHHIASVTISATLSALTLVSNLIAADVVQGPTTLPVTNIAIDTSGNQKFTPDSKLELNPPAGFGGTPSLTFMLTDRTALVTFKPKTLEFRGKVAVIICESGHEFTAAFINNMIYCFAIVKADQLDAITKASKDELSKLCAKEKSQDAFYKWLQKDATEGVEARLSKPGTAEEKKQSLEAFSRMIIHPALEKALKANQ